MRAPEVVNAIRKIHFDGKSNFIRLASGAMRSIEEEQTDTNTCIIEVTYKDWQGKTVKRRFERSVSFDGKSSMVRLPRFLVTLLKEGRIEAKDGNWEPAEITNAAVIFGEKEDDISGHPSLQKVGEYYYRGPLFGNDPLPNGSGVTADSEALWKVEVYVRPTPRDGGAKNVLGGDEVQYRDGQPKIERLPDGEHHVWELSEEVAQYMEERGLTSRRIEAEMVWKIKIDEAKHRKLFLKVPAYVQLIDGRCILTVPRIVEGILLAKFEGYGEKITDRYIKRLHFPVEEEYLESEFSN